MVPFGGWDMPVQYPDGIIHEVNQVRNNVGIFDVSHMARLGFDSDVEVSRSGLPAFIESEVPDLAATFLDTVLSVKASDMGEWQARYHVICNEDGGIIDDAIVYKIPAAQVEFSSFWYATRCFAKPSEHWYLLVVNAGNADADRKWLLDRLGKDKDDDDFEEEEDDDDAFHDIDPFNDIGSQEYGDVVSLDISDQTAMIAVQGPKAVEMLDSMSGGNANKIRRFRSGVLRLGDYGVIATRTGYTGEDGFEIICFRRDAVPLWELLVNAGAAPCGLGARDVLRLEAGLMLHGSDMTVETNPYEAGLGWTVKNDSPDYVAGDALRKIRAEGTARRIVGFEMRGRGIARQGHAIFDGDREVGIVTSGTMSPTLGKAIGMGYVPSEMAKPGTPLSIEIRGRRIDAHVVKMPFYRRSS